MNLCFSTLNYTGTTKFKNIKENIGSLALKLTQEDLIEICNAVPIDEVSGPREVASLSKYACKFADTPSNMKNVTQKDRVRLE